MSDALYPKVVVGFQATECGEDAKRLGELLAESAGGELELVEVEHGSPAGTLHDLAERGEADLIVLGSTHRGSLGLVAPGSVAEHLLKGARCRLAIAPRGYAHGDRLRVVAVGFDGSHESEAALAEAAELARRAGAAMRVIGVSAPRPPDLPEVAAKDRFDLQSLVHDAAAELPSELRALPVHEKGDPADKLLERAEEGVDLLVLGSRGLGPVKRVLAGSVCARVIRRAPCPVLITPRPAA